MKSFIKSHRSSNSYDGSPTKWNSSVESSQLSIFDSEYLPTLDLHKFPTMSSMNNSEGNNSNNNNSNSTKHSSSLESFHRLANKKMFSTKLFKKNSNMSLNLNNNNGHFAIPESTSAPSTPRNSHTAFENSNRFHNNDNATPAIKGTITHAWGTRPETGNSVIVLNDPSENHSKISGSSDISDVDHGSKSLPSKNSSIKSNEILLPPTSTPLKAANHSWMSPLSSPIKPNHATPKKQNKLQRGSSLTDEAKSKKEKNFVENFGSIPSQLVVPRSRAPYLDSNSLRREASEHASKKSVASTHSSLASTELERQSSGITFLEATPEIKKTKPIEHNNGRNSDYSSSEDENEDDNSSQFSFEIDGINGRTVSMKYYSKPEPANNVYIDDLYEDEDFDENLNFYGDSIDDIEFPSEHYGLGDEESFVSLKVDSANNSNILSNGKLANTKNLKKYNDLFDLSDDLDDLDDNSRDDYEEETVIMNEMCNDETDDSIYVKNPILPTNEQPKIRRSSSQNKESISKYSNESDGLKYQHNFDENVNSNKTSDIGLPNQNNNASHQHHSKSRQTSESSNEKTNISFKANDNNQINNLKTVTTTSEDEPDDFIARINTSRKTYIESSKLSEPTSLSNKANQSVKINSFSDIFDVDEEDDFDFDKFGMEDYENDDYGINSNNYSSNSPSISFASESSTRKLISPPKNKVSTYNNRIGNSVFLTTNLKYGSDNHYSNVIASSRYQPLKYHELNSSMDAEIPGAMGNLYFIDEIEEDIYNKGKVVEEDFLDEINKVPEDFCFSDSELELSPSKSPLNNQRRNSFRRTHSYSGKPTVVAKNDNPVKNKFEINNKTVTFFSHQWQPDARSNDHGALKSPMKMVKAVEKSTPISNEEQILSTPKGSSVTSQQLYTPDSHFGKPIPENLQELFLSPIQEGYSSVESSPRR